jgi:hypothetical protein
LRVPRLVLAGLLAVLVLAGCGGYGDDNDGGSTSTTTSTTATTADPLANASTDTVTAEAASDQTALVEAVGMSGHDSYDRIVFTFKNAVPGYTVGYVEKPIVEDGSGAKVDIAGDTVLSIRMEPASGFDLNTGEGVLVYKGPKRIAAVATGTKVVQELVRTGDFEAVLTWAAGLPDKVPFAVSAEDNPPRLVVDVKNP